MSNKHLLATFTLIGTIIGAGIFGLPYVASKTGLLITLGYMIMVVIVTFLLHSFFAEIILRTKEKLLLPGLSKKYLGRKSEIIVLISLIIGVTGSLFAYIVLSGSFLKILVSPFIDVSENLLSIIVWALLSILVLLEMRVISKTELTLSLLFIFVVIGLFFFSVPVIDVNNYSGLDFSNFLLPFGVVMFSFFGLSAIPSVLEILRTPEERSKIKKVIKISLIISFLIYLIFILSVLGISGSQTTEDSFTGLISLLGQNIVFIGAFFGIITCATSYIVVADYFKDTLTFDFNLSPILAFLIACGLPLALLFSGIIQFIEALSLMGSFMGVIQGIVIILIFKKIRRVGNRMPEYSFAVPPFVLLILSIILIGGAISQLIYFF